MVEERRTTGDPRRIEFRAVDVTGSTPEGSLSGYGSTWWSVDGYGTAFAPGAWTKTLAERGDKVHILWAHDPAEPIGVPLDLREDPTGLAIDVALVPGVRRADEALALLKAAQGAGKARFGLSVGFRTISERPADPQTDPLAFNDGSPAVLRANPEQVSVITEAKLYEISLVTFPANEDAMVTAARSDAQLEAIATALADLRAGRLAPSARAMVAELAAAWSGQTDGGSAAPRPGKAPRRLDAETLLARHGRTIRRAG